LELEWQDSSRFSGGFRIEVETWTYEFDFPIEEDGMKFKYQTKICLLEPIPDKIDFTPSDDYIDMMDDLRKTILKTPEDVADLKSEIDITALLDQESNLVELY
jgi:hypothetical protein